MDFQPTAHARALLEVLQWPGVGQATARDLARVASAQKVDVRELASVRVRVSGSYSHESAIREAAQILHECDRLDVTIVALGDPQYPERLAEIPDAPPVLYVKGDTAALSKQGVAVVGTREASTTGLRAAEVIGEFVVRRGLTVISGLALGIDAAAHTGALKGKGVTIAILANGLDTISPKTNAPIAEKLLSSGGALVSEHPPGVPARPAEFVRRNRIQSGMSICSIIVESGEKGGAMHQASFTVQQKRPLLTVLSRGSNGLNEAGARKLVSEFAATPVHGTAELGQWLDRFLQGKTEGTGSVQGELDW